MKLHEFQAKDQFKKFGIPVPKGLVVRSPKDVLRVVKSLNGPPWVVKAQVHAGGRGKGGGIRVVNAPSEAAEAVATILERPLVTKQTGPEGQAVHQVLIEEAVDIDRELYLAVTVDRSKGAPVMIFSSAGGMEIEEVAKKSPHLIQKELIHPETGWMPYQGRTLAYRLDPVPSPEAVKGLIHLMGRLYELFVTTDCSLAEINPLAVMKQGGVLALDAKMDLDDNALFRQKALGALEDPKGRDPLDAKAAEYNLSYIRLDGSIGAMVNGAGLAMATMDVIKMAGAEPANFLDVGGGASEEKITKGFEIILEDKKVKAILINIFGGILRCDVLAKGVLAAVENRDVKVPLIVRLEGTNVAEGRKILKDSGLEFQVAGDMSEAADMVARQMPG